MIYKASFSTFALIHLFLEKSAITCKQRESVVGNERLNEVRVSPILQQISLKLQNNNILHATRHMFYTMQ